MRRRRTVRPYGTKYTLVWLYQPKGGGGRDDGLVEIPAGLGTPRVCLGDPREHDWRRVSGTICIIYPNLDTTTLRIKRTMSCLLAEGAKMVAVVWPDDRELETIH